MAPDVWLLAASLSAGLGLARLTGAPGAAHVVGPVVATVLAGHVAASAARRLRVPLAAVLAAGCAAVVLGAVWALLLSSTDHGVPTPTAWRALVHQVARAGAVIRSHPTPLPATTGVVLCIALGAGLVAVLGRVVWAYEETRRPPGGWRTARPLLALVPSFGIVCYASLLSSQVDRVAGAIWYLVSVLGFVVVADRLGTPARTVAATVGGVLPATALAALAVVVPVALSPGLTSLRVDALPFSQAAGTGGGGGLEGTEGAAGGVAASGVRAIDLIDDLRAIITTRSADVMFSASSPVPTYWQVGALTHFVDDAWVPDPTTLAAAQSFAIPTQNFIDGIPVLPEPTGGATFTAELTIADLESTLLPVPPTTVSVSDVTATILPGVGALHPFETPPGLVYSAIARTPLTAAPTATASSEAGIPQSALVPYLGLPSLSPRIVALAHHIVSGATTPMAKALDIVRWFTGGRFRYTLTPPSPGAADPLVSFLFTTRAGFCQQFAGAYAVLARLDGLPTRVAVGFTTGSLVGRDRYQVTGADAHVWPEVYLGPAVGWTSFEPTPATSGDPNGVGVFSARGAAPRPSVPRVSTTTSTTLSLRRLAQLTPSTVPKVAGGTGARSARASAGSEGGTIAAWVALALVLAASAGLLLAYARRRAWRGPRRGRRPHGDPSAAVVAEWRLATVALERARLGRRPTETLAEHAARLGVVASERRLPGPVTWAGPASATAGTGSTDPLTGALGAYTELAELAARASYAPGPCSPADAHDAARLCDAVRRELVRRDGGRRAAARP